MQVRIEAPVVAKKNGRKMSGKSLKALDGQAAATPLSRYIADGGETTRKLSDIDIGGGSMRLEGRSTGLVVISEYDCERRLTAAELRSLVAYTRAQWLEGVGESFAAEIEQAYGARLVIDVAKSNAKQPRGGSTKRAPILTAVDAGDLEAVRLRLDAGDDVQTRNRQGDSLIQVAIKHQDDALGAELVRAGAELVMETYGHSMLWAARSGMVDTVRAFLESGVEPDLPAGNGMVSLAAAINQERIDVARALLDAGADVNLVDANRYTAAHHAQSAEALELLLDHGARLDIPNLDGETVLEDLQRDVVVETHWRTGEKREITEGGEYERRVERNAALRPVLRRRGFVVRD